MSATTSIELERSFLLRWVRVALIRYAMILRSHLGPGRAGRNVGKGMSAFAVTGSGAPLPTT